LSAKATIAEISAVAAFLALVTFSKRAKMLTIMAQVVAASGVNTLLAHEKTIAADFL
jgi:hypothetical protein